MTGSQKKKKINIQLLRGLTFYPGESTGPPSTLHGELLFVPQDSLPLWNLSWMTHPEAPADTTTSTPTSGWLTACLSFLH